MQPSVSTPCQKHNRERLVSDQANGRRQESWPIQTAAPFHRWHTQHGRIVSDLEDFVEVLVAVVDVLVMGGQMGGHQTEPAPMHLSQHRHPLSAQIASASIHWQPSLVRSRSAPLLQEEEKEASRLVDLSLGFCLWVWLASGSIATMLSQPVSSRPPRLCFRRRPSSRTRSNCRTAV